jgi:hypothetical protein
MLLVIGVVFCVEVKASGRWDGKTPEKGEQRQFMA